MERPRSVKSPFVATTTVFGTPTDITPSELAMEMLFPADEATVAIVRLMVAEEAAHRPSDAPLQRAS